MVDALLLAVGVVSIELKKAYKHLSARQPAEGERTPRHLHAAFKHIPTLSFLFDLITFSMLSLLALNIADSYEPLPAFVIILGLLALILGLLGKMGTNPLSEKLATALARPIAYCLNKLKTPVSKFERLEYRLDKNLHRPQLLSEKALLDLLTEQRDLSDDKTKEDLSLALSGLDLNKQKVSYLMTRKQKAKLVESDESIGPILLSELHETGRTAFGVKNDDGEIIGTIRLRDLNELKSGGKAVDALDNQVIRVGAAEPVINVIRVFLKSSSELLFAEDETKKIVGLIYLEDVLKTLAEDESATA